MVSKLEKELQNGKSQFSVSGTVSIKSTTFPEKDAAGKLKETVSEKTGFSYMRVGFPVTASDNQSVYVTLFGGHNPSSPEKDVIYATEKETNKSTKIKWSLRKNEEVLKKLTDWSFIRIKIEKDEDGKLIEKRFLSAIDAIEYLEEHLKDKMSVYVNGTIDYQEYNGEVQRSYNISQITLNQPKEGKKARTFAKMKQTYLVDDKALPKKWESELEDNGKITLALYVPQYVGGNVKKVMPLAQDVTVRAEKDKIDKVKKLIKLLFIPNGKAVREITVFNDIVYGVEEVKGEVELTPEVQELIDMGIMDLEEVQRADTITGSHVDELVYDRPVFEMVNGRKGIMMEDKYSLEAMTVMDEENEIDEIISSEDEDDLEEIFK